MILQKIYYNYNKFIKELEKFVKGRKSFMCEN